jgi:hypothetical protein
VGVAQHIATAWTHRGDPCPSLVEAAAVPAPYDVNNFLRLLGIEIDEHDPDQLAGGFTVRHDLIAGTGYLWAPVVIALADALCAFGVSRHWPIAARSCCCIRGPRVASDDLSASNCHA